MTPTERAAAQTAIRHKLRENGYTPLANVNKVCVLTGWPGLAVDAAQIEVWSEQLRYQATGVRVDGRLVVVDFDIDDDGVLDTLWGLLPEDVRERLDDAPMRFGGGVKMAVFLRLAEGEAVFGRMVSQAYSPVGSDGTQRVEVFGSGAPRQFGVYGPRSHDDAGVMDSEYTWSDDRGLCEVPLVELPCVTVKELEAICDAGSAAMRGAGWTYEVQTHGGVVDGRPVFDLVDDMEFVTAFHGVVDLPGLEALCADSTEGVRLSASWLEGVSAVNTSRCIARLSVADGRVQIWESAACVLHRPRDMDLGGKIRDLGERLRGSEGSGSDPGSEGRPGDRLSRLLEAVPEDRRFFAGASGVGGSGGEDDEDELTEEDAARGREFVIRHLLDSFAYWPAGSGYVVCVGGGPEQAMSMSSFRNLMLPWSWKQKRSKRANAAEDDVNPVDVWLKHPERVVVGGYRFMPVSRERLIEIDGERFVNIWERPAWWDDAESAGGAGGAGGEAVAAFQMFMEHLIPDARERDWFTMWLAAKVQKPWLPNCGVLMVAEKQGSGRGTLFDMLGGVFGQRHVKPVTAVQLIGGGSQSQYTDWLESALLITCDEVLAGDDAGGAMAWKRREVYERLKALVDPRARWASIVRKGLPNYESEVFASYLMATNNPNALPLSVDDRRFAVVTNTVRQLVERWDVMKALEPWRCDRRKFKVEFSSALYAWLRGVAVKWAEVRESPRWMAGREAMLNANESDLDAALDTVLRRIEGDFVLGHHLRERLGRSLESIGALNETKGWWNKAQDVLSRPNRLGWRKMNGRHRFDAPKDQGSLGVTSVFYREEGVGVDAWLETPPSDRRALWGGGDPSARASVESLTQRMADRKMKQVE